MMADGVIFCSISGFYYVETENGTVRCKARGRFRHLKIKPLVGDKVRITLSGDGDGMIDEVLPRKNEFLRPPVANLDVLALVVSEAVPSTDPFVIDQMTAAAEMAGVEPLICINKCDLNPGAMLFDIYSKAGFKTIRTSVVTGEGIEALKSALNGVTAAFAGDSGVGKSSLLNCIAPGMDISTGDISDKLNRGRHTTRQVRFYRIGGMTIADTPGFAALDTEDVFTEKEDIQKYFREFSPYTDNCRYTGCAHIKEDGCAVLDALREGKIHPSRHRSYTKLYEQAKAYNSWEKK